MSGGAEAPFTAAHAETRKPQGSPLSPGSPRGARPAAPCREWGSPVPLYSQAPLGIISSGKTDIDRKDMQAMDGDGNRSKSTQFKRTPDGEKTKRMLEVEGKIRTTLEDDYQTQYINGDLGQKRLANRWGVTRNQIFGSHRDGRRSWIEMLGLPKKGHASDKKPEDDPRGNHDLATAAHPLKIFISYCHQDSKWIARLDVHLKPLADASSVMHWDDRKIKPGSKWREEIRLAIDAASIAILMISADYLASEFITENEIPPLLKAAEERGCRILPIILSPCGFLKSRGLAQFQPINLVSRPLSGMNHHDRETPFARVAETIEGLLPGG